MGCFKISEKKFFAAGIPERAFLTAGDLAKVDEPGRAGGLLSRFALGPQFPEPPTPGWALGAVTMEDLRR